MTETRKWTLGAALLMVVALVAGWFLLISPKRAEVADLELQTAAQERTNSSLETELAVLKQQNKELPEKQAELAALRTKIPQVADLPSYIREMQDTGRQAGVSFASLTPSAAVELGGSGSGTGALTPDQLAAINVDMVIGGSYFEITKFLNELETSSRYTLVSGYTIGEEGAEESSGSSTELTATVNARIYLVPATPEVIGDETAASGSTTPSPAPAP